MQKFFALFLTGLLVYSCAEKEMESQIAPEQYTAPSYTDISDESESIAIDLVDIAKAAGINFVHENGAFGKKWMPETMGSGGGFLDYNGDGLPDILLVNSKPWREGSYSSSGSTTLALYQNLGAAKFKNVTNSAGLDVSLYGMGCAFADYDADGDVDIYLTAVGANKLLRNDGGVFYDVTDAARVSGNDADAGVPPAWSTSAAWLDYDGDGWLDLFVCNYVKWTPETDIFTTLDGKNKSYATPEQYQGETSRLYRNLGDGRFEGATEKAGVFNPEGKSLGVAIADFNDDGWPDLAIANDTQPNFLYLNQRDGSFENIALQAGIAYDEVGRARAGMGIDIADLANDGKLSIAIGNFAREPISLYTQIDQTLFQDRAGAARITRPSLLNLTFGLLFADLDLDGYQDLLTANGHIEPAINAVQQDIAFAQSPQLFHNNRAGQLVDITEQLSSSFREPTVARGLASADIDEDGDLDILLTVNAGSPRLFRNDLPAGQANWLKILLRGKHPNQQAFGTKITIYAGDLRQSRLVRTGSSYLSQSDISKHTFGLGAAGQADSILVRWPTTNAVTRLGKTKANQIIEIRQ